MNNQSKKDLYQELAEYTGQSYDLVRERCKFAPVELAWQWKNKTSIESYYKDTDLYLFDLTGYQQTLRERGYHDWYRGVLNNEQFKIKSVLDYGGGIGEYSIIAGEEFISNVSYLDFKDSETYKYAVERFKNHGSSLELLDETSQLRMYDLIVCMDVLEHIEHPEELIEQLARSCRYMIANPEEIPYNVFYPQHISHPQLTAVFEKVQGNLWKSKLRD